MTLPCVFHDVFIVVADTLAEAFDSEVGSPLWILRMFETNLQQGFLKFERFSSLRKRCRVTRRGGPVRLQTVPQLRAANAAIVATRERTTASVRLAADFIRQPTNSPCGAIPRSGRCVFARRTAHAAAPCRVGSLLLDPRLER